MGRVGIKKSSRWLKVRCTHLLRRGNRIAPAGVTFQRADENERPSFNIVFQWQETNTVAVAFFPPEYVKGYSRVTVYDSGVLPQNSTSLSNILCHEFGHVLGFRHSFALEKEQQRQAGRVGEPDKKSIMSYKFPPKINLQDVQTSREVYENFTGGVSSDLDDGLGNQLELMVRWVPA